MKKYVFVLSYFNEVKSALIVKNDVDLCKKLNITLNELLEPDMDYELIISHDIINLYSEVKLSVKYTKDQTEFIDNNFVITRVPLY